MNLAVGEEQGRGQIIRHSFVPQFSKHRKIDRAIGVCKAPAYRRPAGKNLGDGAALELRGLEQIERSLPDFDLGSRPPDEPTAHDVRVQGAHEHRYSPERNAAAAYLGSRHHSAFVCKIAMGPNRSSPAGLNKLKQELMAANVKLGC